MTYGRKASATSGADPDDENASAKIAGGDRRGAGGSIRRLSTSPVDLSALCSRFHYDGAAVIRASEPAFPPSARISARCRAVELLLEALQRQADDVAMVQLGADVVFRGEAQPEIVQTVDILRPKPRRMRSQVHVGRRAVGDDHFERKRMARRRQSVPTPVRCAAPVPRMTCARIRRSPAARRAGWRRSAPWRRTDRRRAPPAVPRSCPAFPPWRPRARTVPARSRRRADRRASRIPRRRRRAGGPSSPRYPGGAGWSSREPVRGATCGGNRGPPPARSRARARSVSSLTSALMIQVEFFQIGSLLVLLAGS